MLRWLLSLGPFKNPLQILCFLMTYTVRIFTSSNLYRPVLPRYSQSYSVFELRVSNRMHYVCFHCSSLYTLYWFSIVRVVYIILPRAIQEALGSYTASKMQFSKLAGLIVDQYTILGGPVTVQPAPLRPPATVHLPTVHLPPIHPSPLTM